MSPPDDADDLRGMHFKRLLGKAVPWVPIAVVVVAGGVAGAVFVSPAVGLGIAVAVLIAALAIVFAIADARAADDFFNVYAGQRGMSLGGRSALPAATPLLRKGDDRYAERTLSGPLADGVDGTLALYTYEEETTDSDGNRQTSYYHYTLGLVEVPECAEHVPELYCRRRFGPRALERFEDVFRGSKKRVELESEALDERYEIFADDEQDAVWLRRLFAPTFIVWLSDEAPKKFAFELVAGALCCYVHGHKDNAADLDMVRAAAAVVAKRLGEESLE